jgi:hypothetical protein
LFQTYVDFGSSHGLCQASKSFRHQKDPLMERAAQEILAQKQAMMRASTPTRYHLWALRAFVCALLCKATASSAAAKEEIGGLVE